LLNPRHQLSVQSPLKLLLNRAYVGGFDRPRGVVSSRVSRIWRDDNGKK